MLYKCVYLWKLLKIYNMKTFKSLAIQADTMLAALEEKEATNE